MKKPLRLNSGLNQSLAQEFLVMRRKAQEKHDIVSTLTLNVIINGIMDLTQAIADGRTEKSNPFSSIAFGTFSDLVDAFDNPKLLKKAGMHYLIEWQLPKAALSHFERARDLGSEDETLPMLIDIASIAVHRESGKGFLAGKITTFPGQEGKRSAS